MAWNMVKFSIFFKGIGIYDNVYVIYSVLFNDAANIKKYERTSMELWWNGTDRRNPKS